MRIKIDKLSIICLLAIQTILQSSPLSYGQNATEKQPANQDKPLRLRTDEVIVDVVVLDKKNRPVDSLTADDFEVFEDSAKQKIISFRHEYTAASDINSGQPEKQSGPSTVLPNLVSLVFDAQTTRDGALRARKAALDYIDKGMGPNDYAAVFGFDLGLLVLAPYTNDKARLRQAVDVFTSKESKRYNAVANEVRAQLESLVRPSSDAERLALADNLNVADLASPLAPDQNSRTDTATFDVRGMMLEVINLTGLKILRTFDRYEREFQGWRSVSALLAIINGQRSVRSGRKSLLLFSEGFAVAPAIKQQYLSIISAANTSGVTLYALDIAGLRVVSPNEELARERDAAATARVRNPNPELVSGGVSSLGRMEENSRLNVVTTLDELAEDTGGFTVKNTNDLSEGLKRILDELGNHYVITYTPTNQSYKGEFRRINVKLTGQSDYRVRARRGYYAIRSLDDSPVLSHEVPLFERLNDAAQVGDFSLNAQALSFRGIETQRQVALYAQFPISVLKFENDDKTKTFSARYALLVLVKNSSNEIVRKLGQEFSLHGPLAQLDDIKSRPQIYNRLVWLAPGKYTLEAVARDSLTGKSAIARTQFDVNETGEDKLRISSVVLSRGLNPLTEDQKKQGNHPLYLEGQAYFVPNLSETFSQARDKNLLVHFNVYVPKGSTTKVGVKVEFLENGKVITEAAGALPDADQTGRILYLTSFPLGSFKPGDYQTRITVESGAQRATSTAHFVVEP